MNTENIIPHNIRELKPYVAGKTIAEVKNEFNLSKISKLASNENRMGCSPLVKEAVLRALESIQDYPDPVSKKLREAIADRNGVNDKEVMLAAGSESIISILCRTFFNRGENAVTADATFVGFFVQAGVQEIKLKKVPITNRYKFDVDEILKEIDSNTKMVYLANPNNPTGTYLSHDEYKKLVDGVPEEVLLVADEAYFEYAEDVPDYLPALEYRKDNVIILRTFSKAYGMAGLRIGYTIAHPDLIKEMLKTKLTFEPTATAQAAALAAYHDEDFLKRSVELVEKGRKRLYTFFDRHNMKYEKSISNSVMVIFNSEQQAIDFTQGMLERGVILRRINAFGLPNCVRITIGTESEMDHFEESFQHIYSELSIAQR
jgi:histidinol-phosphate aminotransferase